MSISANYECSLFPCCVDIGGPISLSYIDKSAWSSGASLDKKQLSPIVAAHCRLLHNPSLMAVWLSLGITHGPHLAVTSLLWLVGIDIVWNFFVSQRIMSSHDRWLFPPIFRGHWQSPYTAPTAGKCLPSGLCKETMIKSTVYGQMATTFIVYFCYLVVYLFGCMIDISLCSIEFISHIFCFSKSYMSNPDAVLFSLS